MFGFAVPNATIGRFHFVAAIVAAVSRQMTHLTSIFPHGTRSLSYWTGFKRSMRLDSPLFPTKSVHLNDNSVSLAILTNNGWFSTWFTRMPLFNQSITIGIYDMNCQWQDWSIGTRPHSAVGMAKHLIQFGPINLDRLILRQTMSNTSSIIRCHVELSQHQKREFMTKWDENQPSILIWWDMIGAALVLLT